MHETLALTFGEVLLVDFARPVHNARMETGLIFPVTNASVEASHRPPQERIATRQPSAPLFRFHLRQMLAFVALASAVMAVLVSVSGPMAMSLVIAFTVIGLHLFSTALGSRLRLQASQVGRNVVPKDVAETPTVQSSSLQEANRANSMASTAPAPWHRRGGTPLPWLPKLVVIGMLVGGIAGATLMALTLGPKRSAAAIAVSSLSLAVMGGWFGFLGGGFYAIVRHGVQHAVEHHESDENRRRQATSH